ncbi:MAG TPA: tetraacyldisaccharide 4'-kinase [Vicinamibacteria bacterium]|jgi:tetraacyldisaccharide 4'-kinase
MSLARGPLAWLYGALVSARNRRYDRDPSASVSLPARVASVGNVTVGGSGKTPFVAALARELIGRGDRVAVLSRGYGRRSKSPFVLVSDGRRILASAEESGDEPLELARGVEGLAVAVGPDRAAVGRRLVDLLGFHVIVLDDGFQHRRVRRNLDLVCFDAREPLESLRLLPRGRLREPLENLSRAHAVVWTRWSEDAPSDELRRIVDRAAPELPAIRTRNRLVGFASPDGSERLGAESFRGRPVALLLGVARPERIVESVPADVVFTAKRRDHHWWDAAEVKALAEEGKRQGAEALLTTGKDAVKMAVPGAGALALPLYVIRIETEILDLSALRDFLERLRP